MQIPPDVKNCVVFIGYQQNSHGALVPRPAGTAFFVSYPLEKNKARGDGARVVYIVTAAHVVRAIQSKSADGEGYLRSTNAAGEAHWNRVKNSAWTFSDDSTVDVAIALVGLPKQSEEGQYGHKSIPVEMFTTHQQLLSEGLMEGSDLFFPGLFVHHYGDTANIPIIRQGALACATPERIKTSRYGPIRGYLAEARSIGGLSGSPVLLCPDHIRTNKDGVWGWHEGQLYYFLGLVHGHYDIRDILDADSQDAQDMTNFDGIPKSINMGIAIVVSAEDILSVLDRPEMIAARTEFLAQMAADGDREMPPTD